MFLGQSNNLFYFLCEYYAFPVVSSSLLVFLFGVFQSQQEVLKTTISQEWNSSA